jgi:hypothetical protein
MRARLTRSEGMTRAYRRFDNPHESPRTTLPVLLTVDEAADLLRTTRRADLRDDRASSVAWRHPRPPASAPARRRFA